MLWFSYVINSSGKLTVLFVCHRTVSMTAVYQLKIKYDQDKFEAVFLDAFDTIKRAVSFPLEDKHVVNEHHVIWKSHEATQKMSARGAFQCTTWLVWNVLAASKTFLWRRQKNSWVSRSTGNSNRVQTESQELLSRTVFSTLLSLVSIVQEQKVKLSAGWTIVCWMHMVMTSDEAQIQMFADWPMSYANRVTLNSRQKVQNIMTLSRYGDQGQTKPVSGKYTTKPF